MLVDNISTLQSVDTAGNPWPQRKGWSRGMKEWVVGLGVGVPQDDNNPGAKHMTVAGECHPSLLITALKNCSERLP